MFSEEVVGRKNEWKSEVTERNQELCGILENRKKNRIAAFLMVVDDTDYIRGLITEFANSS